MDVIFTNNLVEEEPDDDSKVGDNALEIDRGASFLMGADPTQDPVKPITKASIGDAPMGEKPTENPLDSKHLSLSSHGKTSGGNNEPDTSFGGETTIAKASDLGPNPLGLNPFGLDESELEKMGISLQTAPFSMEKPVTPPVKEEPVPVSVGELASVDVKEPVIELKKGEEPKEVPLANVYSLYDPDFPGGRIIFNSFSFGSMEVLDDNSIQDSQDEETLEATLKNDEDDQDKSISTDSEDDDPMGLAYGVSDLEDELLDKIADTSDSKETPLKDSPSEKKPQADASEEMDPLKMLLLSGGNPFGENSRSIAPDLSFGKEALKPKHFEPMKASGPRVTAENVQENNPLGNNPFGKEVAPDASFGKEALKPKKYTPKKPYEEN